MVHFHLPHKHAKEHESGAHVEERKMSQTSTISSTTSSTSSTSGHGSSISSLSRTHKRPSHFNFEYKEPQTPLELCEMAVRLVFTNPGPSCQELREVYFPRLFHSSGYAHRVNCREVDLNGLLDIIEFVRTKWKHSHIRIKSDLVDQDGTATMEQAAVALTFDIIAMPHHAHSHEAEERRTTMMAVLKVYQGKLAQWDAVLDTLPMKMPHQELSCSIM